MTLLLDTSFDADFEAIASVRVHCASSSCLALPDRAPSAGHERTVRSTLYR